MPNPFEIPLFRLGRTIVAIKPALVHAIGVEALVFIADNFRLQGYQGRSFIPWAIQKKPNKPRPHKILILDRILINSFKSKDWSDYTIISTDSPYAQVHNEGSSGTVFSRSRMGTFGPSRPFIRNIPQRQFFPITDDDSPILRENCERVIVRKVTEALPGQS